MNPEKIAEYVWIEARRQYVDAFRLEHGRQPFQEEQDVYLRFLVTAEERDRIISWEGGLKKLPVAQIRDTDFETILPHLRERLTREGAQYARATS